MAMKLLMVGAGKGSWVMRGEQLGAALGARVTTEPRREDWTWADVAVLVKRHGVRHAPAAKSAGCPFVWDALDCWRQPGDNARAEASSRAALANEVKVLNARIVIGATEAQAAAAGGVYLPHHSWNGLEPMPARKQVSVVAYQGNPAYLGEWHDRLARSCTARGWRFVTNPPDLGTADLIVALRGGPWDGWQCREWKSGVKLVNAIAAGRPVITQPTAAWREIAPPGTAIETPTELEAALDAWRPVEARAQAAAACVTRAPAYQLSAVAAQYRVLLERARVTCTS